MTLNRIKVKLVSFKGWLEQLTINVSMCKLWSYFRSGSQKKYPDQWPVRNGKIIGCVKKTGMVITR